PEGAMVEVTNPSGQLWKTNRAFKASAEINRFSPVIHVNHVGYQPGYAKDARIGFYLGTLGEMRIPADAGFEVIDAASGEIAYKGKLVPAQDKGWSFSPPPYQRVLRADFSALEKEGVYRLRVPGLGASYPFQIHKGTFAAFARAYALGLYHQRCGTNNVMPFTRHEHGACHVAHAEIPDKSYNEAEQVIAEVGGDAKNDPRHVAKPLVSFDSSLYPFVRTGKIDVSGGHHDAGDYSKYTINSAGLVHYLMFSVDALPGVAELDNLGIPESGDGKSDILQEAKWEADFLAKMQDNDGGFYFLVYPKARRYEDNVLPDKGDTQIVWPKNTSATAAAVAALAEAGSSPTMKKQFPEAADLYMRRALRGWAFLERAIAQHGKDGAYQKLTHYGNEFIHDDELAWAAAALYAATGEKKFQDRLMQWYEPGNAATKRWSWWPMFEGYGSAARTYAYAARSGRLPADKLNPAYLIRCEQEISASAMNQVRFAAETAYGTSFPDPNKANRNAGWYFSSERAFDITALFGLRKNTNLVDAVISNLNYEAGQNPVNVSYITGIGWKRQRDIVHQYAQNDHRLLPPTGIPVGNIQGGFAYLYHYKKELGELPFPPDGAASNPYPFYDRWGDSFNTTTEFVVTDSARSLANLAFWMAQTPIRDQKWQSAKAVISGLPEQIPADQQVTATLTAQGLDLTGASIVWEAKDQDPFIGPKFTFSPKKAGSQWVEAEAQLPDGRRVFASAQFVASSSISIPPNSFKFEPAKRAEDTIAVYPLDKTLTEVAGKAPPLKLEGNAALDPSNVAWMKTRSGGALRVLDVGDKAVVTIPAALLPTGRELITVEAMVFVNEYKAYNKANAKLLALEEDWNSSLEFGENKYEGPMLRGGGEWAVPKPKLTNALPLGEWVHLKLALGRNGYSALLNGKSIDAKSSSELANWGRAKDLKLEFGNFDGWIDEVVISATGSGNPIPSAITAALAAAASAKPEVMTKNTDAVVEVAAPKVARTIKPSPNVKWLKEDAESAGDWVKTYGKNGYKIIGGSEKLPGGTALAPGNHASYSWAEATDDARALKLQPTAPKGTASCWYAEKSFTVEYKPGSSQPQKVSIYFLDWDRVGRVETIDVMDPVSGATWDSRTISKFDNGKYLSWIIKGPVKFQFHNEKGPNALVMGFFFDPATSPTTTTKTSANAK
ncbi:MAG: glycoside hydrolase family 9 protein, partial [Verrucomicrobiales bacterium]